MEPYHISPAMVREFLKAKPRKERIDIGDTEH